MSTPTPQDLAFRRMSEAARRYAAADRTDPFALSRAMSHIVSGAASAHRPANKDYDLSAGAAYYDAEPQRELRKAAGHDGREIEFDVVVYKNVARP